MGLKDKSYYVSPTRNTSYLFLFCLSLLKPYCSGQSLIRDVLAAGTTRIATTVTNALSGFREESGALSKCDVDLTEKLKDSGGFTSPRMRGKPNARRFQLNPNSSMLVSLRVANL